ncbi:MAG: hypothetical protein IJC09_04015 [Clostridia bacterium]|nr:hypothetical protein [Clostridia bacterium]
MKRIIALISAFFMLFMPSAGAIYSGAQIYGSMEQVFGWIDEKVSPLGDTDSVAADYYVMAKKRSGDVFDYNKYVKITNSKTPVTVQDAQRIVMANTAAGGRMPVKFVADCTYNCEFVRASDIAGAITALLSGEYKIESQKTDINRLAVGLLSMQNTDGSFDGNVLSTAKSIIALSFISGNCYVAKGTQMGEKYRYDVNASILRGVNYLQNSKNEDFGFGSVMNTAFVVMALDCAGVDADNDPGFSDGVSSTFSALMSYRNEDGSFGTHPDDTAIASCALVSHLRAMQGNSAFFALRTEDMPYNPNDYIEDINHSGEGLKIETQEEIVVSDNDAKLEADTTEKPYELTAPVAAETEPYSAERKSSKLLAVVVIVLSVIVVAALVTGFVVYVVYARPRKTYHTKKSDDEDDCILK